MNATSYNTTAPIMHPQLLPFISDSHLSVVLPVVAYWIYSLFYEFLDYCNFQMLEPYRIHTPEELTKNRVSKCKVMGWVLFQQALQSILALVLTDGADKIAVDTSLAVARYHQVIMQAVSLIGLEKTVSMPLIDKLASWAYWYLEPSVRFFFAMIILDAYQYWMHRFFHTNKFLYKHLHSVHHRLYVPYAYGALYNHPLEGFLMDSLGGGLSYWLAGLSVQSGAIFFAFSSIKTVDDHSGYDFPWNPLQFLFNNNARYHDIHHQPAGIKMNFSQPFFTIWDRMFGTYAPTLEACREANKRRKMALKGSGSEDEDSIKEKKQ
ncbi:uncharacterized protein VTP21DRAFT_2143 [Calcarisporiella thermophila]|uniref:uncharacterized protein n=1 Tax=Calcarisporiella thermophila TaxID=911321 RepID=UPI003743FAB4